MGRCTWFDLNHSVAVLVGVFRFVIESSFTPWAGPARKFGPGESKTICLMIGSYFINCAILIGPLWLHDPYQQYMLVSLVTQYSQTKTVHLPFSLATLSLNLSVTLTSRGRIIPVLIRLKSHNAKFISTPCLFNAIILLFFAAYCHPLAYGYHYSSQPLRL